MILERKLLSVEDIKDFCADAEAGDRLNYYTGLSGGITGRKYLDLFEDLQDSRMWDFVQKKKNLVREDKSIYEYWMIKRKNIMPLPLHRNNSENLTVFDCRRMG